MTKRMAEAFMTEHWQTPLPITTVDRKDKRWNPNGYWRGDIWPAPNYQVAGGFAQHGYQKIAADIADKTIANALKNGISEHYNPVTGKPLGVPYIGMCCTIVTMMLDGLSSRHELKLKRTS
jgi:glycogen debranching enzyme